MAKYHFIFTDRLGKMLVEYDTDIEPPVMGDIVNLAHMTNNKNETIYVIYDRWYTPIEEKHVEITFTLDLYDGGVLE